ncbi:MAG: thioredoxin family protein [Thermotogaceae bacterium]|nr:thioredoxin family protein [Thermotogota bacterium]NLH20196.1 thioredoxin family protein [Thermotogaceae bacterium]
MEKNVTAALTEMNIEAEVSKVSDLELIIAYGVVRTPGLVIDGRVVSVGKVLTLEQIKERLKPQT